MKFTQFLGLVISTAAAWTSGAATLTTVALQGPAMVHVIVTCNGTQLSVDVEPGVVALTPLDVSNPDDSFASADPWFDTLDTSRRALAFNRQYGFVLAGGSELPVDAAIWIRCLSTSSALEVYRYRASPATWEPMLGFGGSTNLFQWNLAMFHPAFAAPPGTGTHLANFEAVLVNATTGQPWPGAATAPFTLTLTNTPSARPALEASQHFVVKWPVTATDYALEWANDASSADWIPVTNTPVALDGKTAVVLPIEQSKRFYRLSRAPQ